MTTEPGALLGPAGAILLDFDGPVTPLMPPPLNALSAEAARRAVKSAADTMPSDIAATTDHLAVLRWAGTQQPRILEAVEMACIEAEIDAARSSACTPGALAFLRACAEREKPVVIVSNNCPEAVHVFLTRHNANRLVRGVVGRVPCRPDLMKPHPSFVMAGLDLVQRTPVEAILIGDSVTDVQVARATGVAVIGFAKSHARSDELAAAGADALVASMVPLAQAVLSKGHP